MQSIHQPSLYISVSYIEPVNDVYNLPSSALPRSSSLGKNGSKDATFWSIKVSLSAPRGGAEISGPGLKFLHMKMSGSEQLMILIHDGALMLNTLFLLFFSVSQNCPHQILQLLQR